MTMRNLVPFLLLAVIAVVSAYGHQDAIIPLERGKLKELPEKYQPATFSRSDRKLQIGKLSVTIPPCLWQHFSAAKESEFQFAASWYHSPETLPPYLSISVTDAKTKTETLLLINLDTLQPIYLSQTIQTSESSWDRKEQPIEKSCQSQWSVKSTK